MQEFRRERHSISRLTAHLVFVTKYRRRVFDDAALGQLQEHVAKVCATMGCELLACDGEADHIHLLAEYPPKHSISVLVNTLKGTSSRVLRKDRPEIARRYRDGVLWSPSSSATSSSSTSGGPQPASATW
jgi:putative transposase